MSSKIEPKRELQMIKHRVSMRDPKKEQGRIFSRRLIVSCSLGIILAALYYLFKDDLTVSLILFVVASGFVLGYSYFKERLVLADRAHRMEEVFPDFLQLMSSNLRAGITVDRAMLLSAREEFDPLDKEILKTGRDITTGKEIEKALSDMARRINSSKIAKTINIILSGIRSGGDVATLLEETASGMREKSFMEKKASSNVLMYVIFIFLAVSVGAPALFGLSNILVQILSSLLSTLPEVDASISTPFTLSAITITPQFVFYFSLVFILAINIMASLTLGLVSKGEEKEGLKYLLPLLGLSYAVFFVIKLSLTGFVSSFFA